MKKHFKKRTIISILLLLVLSIIIFLIPFRTALVFYEENSNHVRAYLPLKEGDTFQITFTHSIHLTDVTEIYEILPDKSIRQTDIIYEEYGIGMPYNAEDSGTFVYEDGKHHIKDMNRIFPSINLRNGKAVPRHRLVWGSMGEHLVWFKDYFKPGELLTIKFDHLTLWQYLKGVKIHDGEE